MTLTDILIAITKLEKKLSDYKKLRFKYIRYIIIWSLVMYFTYNQINFFYYLGLVLVIIHSINLISNIFRTRMYRKKLDNLEKTYTRYKDINEQQKSNNRHYSNDEYERMFKDIFKDMFNSTYNTNKQDNSFRPTLKTNTEYIDALKLFNLDKTASAEEFKTKYRELSKKWHPDMFSLDSEENQNIANRNFQKLNNAYSIIKKYRGFK